MERFLTLHLTLALLGGCGATVSTGDNLARGRAELAKTAASATPPADTAIPSADATPAGSGASGGSAGSHGPLTCWGPAPALSADFQAFCAKLDGDLGQRFHTAKALICDDKRLVNLLYDVCSWDGKAPEDRYLRVLSQTDVSDQSAQDFHFVGAYAVTTESKLEDQVALAQRELTDPNFSAKFVTIRNAAISNVVKNADGSFDYSAQLASSAATIGFRAHAQAIKISDNLTVTADFSTGDLAVLKEHQLLTFYVRQSDSKTKVFAVDEKLIGDNGNHAVALQNLLDVLHQRMERDYENSRRD